MGIKTVLQNIMPKIITVLGDLAFTGTYHSTGTLVYNPATGTKTETGGSNITITGVMSDYNQDEVDHQAVKITDKKFLIPSATLGVEPKMTDTITISSITYNVISKRVDPAEAMWVIQGRV